jgi:chitodextrinase
VTVVGRDHSLDFGTDELVRTYYVDIYPDLVHHIVHPETIVEGQPISLDASSSLCYPFGLGYVLWDLDGDEVVDVNGTVPEWTFPGEGRFNVEVTLVDTVGNENKTVIRVTVVDSVPNVEIVSEVPDEVDEDEEVTLEGRYTGSVDEVILQEWDFGDGTLGSGASVSHRWEKDGEYTITYTVLEIDGSFSNDTRTITVVNVSPTAVLKVETVNVGKRERFDLDGTASFDTPSDNGSLSYLWDMGGEPFLTGAQAFWRFNETGTYEIRLMVLDDDGSWDSATMTVTVANRVPVIGPIPDAHLKASDPVWSHKLEVSDPDDDLHNLTLVYPEFEPGGAFATWVERDDDGGWTVYVRPKESRDGWRADVEVTVRDPEGAKDSTTFEILIDVTDVPDNDGGGSMLWLMLVAVAILVGLTVIYFRLARRQVPPPPSDEEQA